MREICMSGLMSGMWKRGTVGIVRHRQLKGPETARPDLNYRATSRLDRPQLIDEVWNSPLPTTQRFGYVVPQKLMRSTLEQHPRPGKFECSCVLCSLGLKSPNVEQGCDELPMVGLGAEMSGLNADFAVKTREGNYYARNRRSQ